ncbi:MAG: hypothetical protein U5K38_00770 [Woeseiaceae bacterium]|nr:hypothetical protein [Woeseiaceae bacterium]
MSLPNVDPETWYFSHPDQSKEKTEWDIAIVELEHTFNNGMYATTKVMWDKFNHDLEYFYPFGSFGAYSLADDQVYIYSYDIEESGERLTFSQSLGGTFDLGGREHEFFAALEYNDDQEPNRFELLNSFSRALPRSTGIRTASSTVRRHGLPTVRRFCRFRVIVRRCLVWPDLNSKRPKISN